VRPTADIDLFGPESASVVAAAEAVRTALTAAGIRFSDVPYESELLELIDGMEQHMVELVAYRDDADRDGVALSFGTPPYWLTPEAIGTLRARFATWPR
jgi:hypothetical protein